MQDRGQAEGRSVGRDPDEIETTVLDPDDWRREEDPTYRWSPEWELGS